jgi:hypothetical protein
MVTDGYKRVFRVRTCTSDCELFGVRHRKGDLLSTWEVMALQGQLVSYDIIANPVYAPAVAAMELKRRQEEAEREEAAGFHVLEGSVAPSPLDADVAPAGATTPQPRAGLGMGRARKTLAWLLGGAVRAAHVQAAAASASESGDDADDAAGNGVGVPRVADLPRALPLFGAAPSRRGGAFVNAADAFGGGGGAGATSPGGAARLATAVRQARNSLILPLPDSLVGGYPLEASARAGAEGRAGLSGKVTTAARTGRSRSRARDVGAGVAPAAAAAAEMTTGSRERTFTVDVGVDEVVVDVDADTLAEGRRSSGALSPAVTGGRTASASPLSPGGFAAAPGSPPLPLAHLAVDTAAPALTRTTPTTERSAAGSRGSRAVSWAARDGGCEPVVVVAARTHSGASGRSTPLRPGAVGDPHARASSATTDRAATTHSGGGGGYAEVDVTWADIDNAQF